jgi:hypothetical protein
MSPETATRLAWLFMRFEAAFFGALDAMRRLTRRV